jgi:hypothetical protein
MLEDLTVYIFRVQDSSDPEYGGSKILWNVGSYFQINEASQSRRLEYST